MFNQYFLAQFHTRKTRNVFGMKMEECIYNRKYYIILQPKVKKYHIAQGNFSPVIIYHYCIASEVLTGYPQLLWPLGWPGNAPDHFFYQIIPKFDPISYRNSIFISTCVVILFLFLLTRYLWLKIHMQFTCISSRKRMRFAE